MNTKTENIEARVKSSTMFSNITTHLGFQTAEKDIRNIYLQRTNTTYIVKVERNDATWEIKELEDNFSKMSFQVYLKNYSEPI